MFDLCFGTRDLGRSHSHSHIAMAIDAQVGVMQLPKGPTSDAELMAPII